MFDDATKQYNCNTIGYDEYDNKIIDKEIKYSDVNIVTNTNINNTITAINDMGINNQNAVVNNDFLDYFNGKYLYNTIQYTYTNSSEFKVDPFSELIYTNNLLLMLI